MIIEAKLYSLILLFSCTHASYRIKLYNHNTDSNNVFSAVSSISEFFQFSMKNKALHLNSNNEGIYYGMISLGTPLQNFEVVFGTGLPYFWVPSGKCKWFNLACRVHKLFDSSKSATYKGLGKSFSLNDGELSGFISQDTLTIGNVIINNQTFGEVNKQGFSAYFNKFDGYLGLAFPLTSSTGIPPLTSMISNHLLEKRIFSVFLNSHDKEDFGGEIIFGGWDESKFNLGSTEFIPLKDNTAWIFDIDYIVTFDGEELCAGCQALADTGTALIVGHAEVVEEIYKKIGATMHGSEAMVECSHADKLPPITFQIHNRSYTLDGHDYVIKKKYLFFFTKCVVGILGNEKPFKPWILGNIFLKKFYSIFDIDNKQIAFANLK